MEKEESRMIRLQCGTAINFITDGLSPAVSLSGDTALTECPASATAVRTIEKEPERVYQNEMSLKQNKITKTKTRTGNP